MPATRQPSALSVTVIEDFDRLETYRVAWDKLHARTSSATFFQTFEWFQCLWRHFGEEHRLLLFAVERDGETVGLLPFAFTREKTRVGSFLTATYPLQDWGTYFGPVGDEPETTLTEVLRFLRREMNDWQILDFRWVEATDLARAAHRRALQANDMSFSESAWQTCWHIDCRNGYDHYLETRSSKFRNEIRRTRKKISKLGKVTFERYRPDGAAAGSGDPNWSLYDEVVDIARNSWQAHSQSGNTLSHAPVAGFFRDAHGHAARLGMLDLLVMRVEGKALAFSYGYVHAARLSALRLGFDPEIKKAGPGLAVLDALVQDSFQRGDSLINMGAWDYGYKHRWARPVSSFRLTHYPRWNPRALALKLKRELSSESWERPYAEAGGLVCGHPANVSQ